MKIRWLALLLLLVAGFVLGASAWAGPSASTQALPKPRFEVERQERILFIRDTRTGACFVGLNEGGITTAPCG